MTPQAATQAQRARARMVERLREIGIRDERVLDAINRVPRHAFVEEALASRAYEDTALPLGFGQTISQPFVVARMAELLIAGGRMLGKTLEVGAGCGYQAAVLSYLASDVYAIERIGKLLDRARSNLRPLRLPNVRLKHADGSLGLSEVAPFDSIILAAAASAVPRALVDQLAPEGRMIMPLTQSSGHQVMLLIERQRNGALKESRLDAVRFVPLLPGTE
ncbi:MAG: protein-L-isoaspartate O-methyltransferase [Candidatus Dactylopiibacterium carminicum]|uniref:Protein-L-isoaspartate O-methyltransferase n=1 Tax=Candidatus Dactylopiibacterium carminicum TaxID=857335 RepID=A0A272ERB6_9RHOO|nr:protein-L-isoaspartate(D-aspartate) O-methyltransferase [Candidatus Dactylopiibacterium carminicum]KAF7598733.1 protein-L-isoaspartate(D-aspartate) O-methyltransferase [Candidatus Dactylopiibacterium carminicum]PAS92645.1 MAG: protein-L-isoaspartate O-methyltransferase [Candidatus Dactylopiibacterium carminicum]PAS96135.1 MAG: protein-L-isoaspartate O-methyltransferase [Candidatus Dactylopiibacterium carminicum]PAS98753.1 MAG: protein-L-isoaspartate O-methyltransferase [Candidatus Dactylopii